MAQSIVNARELKDGKQATNPFSSSLLIRPIQVLSTEKKDERWRNSNMDWLEWVGLNQIRSQAKRLISNYKTAFGIIEKNDYIPSDENEYRDVFSVLTEDAPMVAEIKNYPIVPIIINVLVSEFAKRNTDVSYVAIDDESVNEILQKKAEDIEAILLRDVQNKIKMRIMELQGDTNNPEYQQLVQLVNNPEALKKLPELEEFYKNNYRTIYEQWAEHQHLIDVERFRMYELENNAFLDLLVSNREFWHFRMLEDDYDIENWDVVTTFYHRSPQTKYISNASYVGNIQLMTLNEVIDKYGRYMDEETVARLESYYPVQQYSTLLTNMQNDGTFYDTNLSYQQNSIAGGGSVQFSRHLTAFGYNSTPTLELLLSDAEDSDFNKLPYLRVTTAYWISYKKVGLYTAIDMNGNKIEKIVTEDFKVTTPPVYNTKLLNEKSERTLVYGEHIEWVWMREAWGGIKIGPNAPTYFGMNDTKITPIYLGINSKDIQPLPFQFKGDYSIFGAKLPVEGIIDNYKYSHSMSIVDILKPYQVGFNIVNNQIADILMDEIGTVIVLDQNTLPKHSLGEDWGQTPYANAYVAMKNFQLLPLDTSLRNTESAINFNQYQKLDLSQTERLLSRIQLAQYFKQQALESIGITPQRLGTPIGQKQTATEFEQSLVSSYSQTEKYFITHCDNIMPRVHEMRTQLAQYYISTKPSFRMQIMLKDKQRVFFNVDGTKFLNKDLNVFISTRANYRAIIEQLKQMMMRNPNTGATIYDLADIMKIETFSELNTKLHEIRERMEQEARARYEHDEKMKQQEIEAHLREKQLEQDFLAQQNELDRRSRLLIAQIKASGYLAPQDMDSNNQSDFIDYMNSIREDRNYQEMMNMKKEAADNKNAILEDKNKLKEKEIEERTKQKMIDYQIARQNKNRYDVQQEEEK